MPHLNARARTSIHVRLHARMHMRTDTRRLQADCKGHCGFEHKCDRDTACEGAVPHCHEGMEWPPAKNNTFPVFTYACGHMYTHTCVCACVCRVNVFTGASTCTSRLKTGHCALLRAANKTSQAAADPRMRLVFVACLPVALVPRSLLLSAQMASAPMQPAMSNPCDITICALTGTRYVVHCPVSGLGFRAQGLGSRDPVCRALPAPPGFRVQGLGSRD